MCYIASRILFDRAIAISAVCQDFLWINEQFRDERERKLHGERYKLDGERYKCIEHETLRQDRVDVAKLSPAWGKVQLHSVAFGWSWCRNRNGLADTGMRTYTDSWYPLKITAGGFSCANNRNLFRIFLTSMF